MLERIVRALESLGYTMGFHLDDGVLFFFAGGTAKSLETVCLCHLGGHSSQAARHWPIHHLRAFTYVLAAVVKGRNKVTAQIFNRTDIHALVIFLC